MSAVVGSLRFYVDESALGLGLALAAARTDTVHCGHPLIPECPLGTLDTDWMPVVAAKRLVVIGRDRRIRSRPGERELLVSHRLRVFRVGGKADQNTWNWLTRFVGHWPQIERIVEERPDGPWFYLVNANGLSEVALPD